MDIVRRRASVPAGCRVSGPKCRIVDSAQMAYIVGPQGRRVQAPNARDNRAEGNADPLFDRTSGHERQHLRILQGALIPKLKTTILSSKHRVQRNVDSTARELYEVLSCCLCNL